MTGFMIPNADVPENGSWENDTYKALLFKSGEHPNLTPPYNIYVSEIASLELDVSGYSRATITNKSTVGKSYYFADPLYFGNLTTATTIGGVGIYKEITDDDDSLLICYGGAGFSVVQEYMGDIYVFPAYINAISEYGNGNNNFFKSNILKWGDWENDSYSLLLVDSSYEYDENHEFVSDITELSATGYARAIVTGKTREIIDDAYLFYYADSVYSFGTIEHGHHISAMVLYKEVTDDNDSLVLGYYSILRNFGGPENYLSIRTHGYEFFGGFALTDENVKSIVKGYF